MKISRENIWQLGIALPAVMAAPIFISSNPKYQAIAFFLFSVSNLVSIIYFAKNKKYILLALFIFYLSTNTIGLFNRI